MTTESEGERTARSLALEQAYVHEVYEQCAERTVQGKHWPKICEFVEELEPGALVCDVGMVFFLMAPFFFFFIEFSSKGWFKFKFVSFDKFFTIFSASFFFNFIIIIFFFIDDSMRGVSIKAVTTEWKLNNLVDMLKRFHSILLTRGLE